MANHCEGQMTVVSKDASAIKRFVQIMQYRDKEFFCYRVFQFEPFTEIEADGEYYWLDADYTVAWGASRWFVDDDDPTNLRGDDAGDCMNAHYTSVTHLCAVLGIGVELWGAEGGIGFAEHAMCDHNGNHTYETEWYKYDYDSDDPAGMEETGFGYGFKEFSNAAEIYNGTEEE